MFISKDKMILIATAIATTNREKILHNINSKGLDIDLDPYTVDEIEKELYEIFLRIKKYCSINSFDEEQLRVLRDIKDRVSKE